MGAAAGPAAAVSSIASIGFELMGSKQKAKADIARAEGESAAALFEAQRSERAAEIGRLRAEQTDAQLREELLTTLGNIDVTRAAANTSLDSPTAIALKGEETRISDRDRTNRTLSLRMQAAEEDAAALYKRKVASDALRYGNMSAKATMLGGYAKAAGGLAKGISGLG